MIFLEAMASYEEFRLLIICGQKGGFSLVKFGT